MIFHPSHPWRATIIALGITLIASLLFAGEALAATSVIANDDGGAGYRTEPGAPLVTPSVLANDLAEADDATTLVETFYLGNAGPQVIATDPTYLSSVIPLWLGTQANGTATVIATQRSTAGTVDVSVNDTSTSYNSRVGGGFEGTLTWDDIVVTGPTNTTTLSARALIDAAVSVTESGNAYSVGHVTATVVVRATPPGGGATSRTARLGSIGSNISTTTSFRNLLQTDPIPIDTRFPVRVEVNLIVTGTSGNSAGVGASSYVANVSAELGNDPSEDVFVVGDGYTVSSASAGIVDNRFADGSQPPLSIQSFDTTGTQGAVSHNGDSTFTYDPGGAFDGLAPGATATDTFTYTAVDPYGSTDTAMVTITIEAPNLPPVAVDDTYPVREGEEIVVSADNGLLANDTHPQGRPLTIAGIDTPGLDGNVMVEADGSFTFAADQGAIDDTSFTYVVTDDLGLTDVGTVTIDILPNDPPITVDDNYTTLPGQPLVVDAGNGLLANDTDEFGDPIRVFAVDDSNLDGTVVVANDGSFTYTPPPSFAGTTTFTYEATDNQGVNFISLPATVTIDVIPTETDLSAVLVEPAGPFAVGEPIVIPVTFTNSGPDDVPEVTAKTSMSGAGATIESVTWPGNTCTSQLGCQIGALGAFETVELTYTLQTTEAGVLNFSTRSSFTGIDTDPSNDNATTRLDITPANQAPVAVYDSYEVIEGTTFTAIAGQNGLLDNDADPEGGPLQVASVDTSGMEGTLDWSPDGSFRYEAPDAHVGAISFLYVVADTEGATASSSVDIDIVPNDPPIANDDTYVATAGEPLIVAAVDGLLANDTDELGDPIRVFNVVDNSLDGTVTVAGDGSFVFTPTANFVGTTSFQYEATDDRGTSFISLPATVTITIPSADVVLSGSFVDEVIIDGPVEDRTYEITLTVVNDGPDVARNVRVVKGGFPLVRFLSSTASQGDCTTPGDCHVGDIAPGESATVTHQVTAGGNHDTGRSTVSFAARTETPDPHVLNDYVSLEYTAIQSPNHPPVAVGDSYSVAFGQRLTISAAEGLLANDGDPDGDSIQVLRVSPGRIDGDLEVQPDGSFVFTPRPGFSGETRFAYVITDGTNESEPATVTINVQEPRTDITVSLDFPDVLYEFVEFDVRLKIANNGPNPTSVTFGGSAGSFGDMLWLSGSSDQGSCSIGGSFECTPSGVLEPGEVFIADFTLVPLSAGGPVGFSFVYDSSIPDTNPNDNGVLHTFTVVANTTPLAGDDSFSVAEDNVLTVQAPGLLANDNDPDGDELSVILGAAGTGTVTPGAKPGAFGYRPDPDFSGVDSFTYLIRDGRGGRAEATVTITVISAAEVRLDLVDAVQALDHLTIGQRRALLVTLRPFGTVEQRLRRLDRFERRLGHYVQAGLVDVKTANALLEDIAALRLAIQ